MAGGVMPKMVIEVPEEFTEVGKAMAEHLAALQRTVSRLGGGKAVDYAEIEQAMAESAGRTELAGHRAILQSLDIDVAAVIIGGVRYTRVGRCEAPYHTMVGSVSVERSLYRQSGARGGQPGGRVVDPVSLRAGVVEDGQSSARKSLIVTSISFRWSPTTEQRFSVLRDAPTQFPKRAVSTVRGHENR